MDQALAQFDPQISSWFSTTYGEPTDIQQKAWPKIAEQQHLLITAPTGSGKTLTAFLWAINQFVTGQFETGSTRVLYVSPLKALNNDIQRNLNAPLAALKARAQSNGDAFPDIRVQTRSGDTDQAERRRMLRHPPEILITTPESLNILLTSHSGQNMLRHVETVILDEIHGVISDKRGVYLMSAVERLVLLAGEFQRISLSATVKPMTEVAKFVAGFERISHDVFKPREIECLSSDAEKRYQVRVRYPEATASRPLEEKVWESLAVDFVERIRQNNSTLLFVNSRALAESLTHRINTEAGETLAYAHHGSLAREIRLDVEQKLKNGELAAIVATSTLEMGIDIGALDEVILIQAPEGIASAIQRIGRAGHGVGEVSRCTIYPTHPLDFIESAVLGKAVLDRDIEPVKMVSCPLDVLGQIIISMTSTGAWEIDELYLELKRSAAFHALTRTQFDLMVGMLNGRYGENRIRELKPKIILDQTESTIESRKGSTMSLYLSGGVIPDRGYFQLRHEASNARIGELDEEFVWEAYVGKVFAFGTQHWQVKKITHNDVIVSPAKPTSIAPPFWKSEGINRSFHYADRIARFLEEADSELDNPAFEEKLQQQHHLEPLLTQELLTLLKRQQEHTGVALPHRHHIVIEHIQTAPGQSNGCQLVIHTGWGNRVNRPFALALEAAWHEAFGEQPEIFVTDQCLVMQLIEDIDGRTLLDNVSSANVESFLRQRLEGSGFFGARFRENAGRALLLSKGKFNERKPLWMSRLQSQKLLDSVLKYEDFPILLETWRSCLQDEFDLNNLHLVLDEIATGAIQVSEISCQRPSPFAQTVAWDQINEYMYMNDKPRSTISSNLSEDLLESLVFQPALRPSIPQDIIIDFVQRRQRTLEGYEPTSAVDLIEWVKERTLIPTKEWWADTELPAALQMLNLNSKTFAIANQDHDWVVENLESLSPTLLGNWLQYYGPLTLENIVDLLGTDKAATQTALTRLIGEQTVIAGQLVRNAKDLYFCDAANFEVLLRFVRKATQVQFEPLDLSCLTPFLFHWQRRWLNSRTDTDEALASTIDLLQCLPANPENWEQSILPARIAGYDGRNLDLMMQSSGLLWVGNEQKRIQFCDSNNLDLLDTADPDNEEPQAQTSVIEDSYSRYDFMALLEKTELAASDLTLALWQDVWRGQVTNDSFAALRTGIQSKYKGESSTASAASPSFSGSPRRSRRAGFRSWKKDLPFAGNWFQVRYPTPTTDLLENEERARERVRLLLDRYGILFRELLTHEQPAFRWGNLFRAIRLMELSGELHSGYFFAGVPGPQFITNQALTALTAHANRTERANNKHSENQIETFWINATDPVSLSGLGLSVQSSIGIETPLPRRIPANYMIYDASGLAIIVEQNGKKLFTAKHVTADNLGDYLGLFHHLLNRSFAPVKKIDLEFINDLPARESKYLSAFEMQFDVVRDHRYVYLQKQLRHSP